MASGFFYNSAGQRESMVAAERKWVDDRTQLILDLKNKANPNPNPNPNPHPYPNPNPNLA